MKTLILGGVRSGKSRLAGRLAVASGREVVYVATAVAGDGEMARRVEAHRKSRPQDWLVVEEPLALGRVLGESAAAGRCLLVDCLTLWLTNLLCHADPERLAAERAAFLEVLPTLAGDLVLVSNETNMGVMPLGELSRRYCDEAGMLHQALAAHCDRVMLTVAGLPQVLKGPVSDRDLERGAGGRFGGPMASDRLVDLLRHGAVVGGGRFRGVRDDPLSASGWAQIHSATEGLKGWDALFSSPARRCAEPARELAARHGLSLELMPELAERRFGDWENRSANELPIAELKRFWDDPVGFTPPGAEPFQALRERVLQGWSRILAYRADFPLVVTHGGVIRVILGQVLDLSTAALIRIEVPPACRTRLRIPAEEGRPSLMFHGGPDSCGAPS